MQLDQYDLEHMPAHERQAIWEQEILNELEANPTSRPSGRPVHEFEQHAKFKQEELQADEIEQTVNINEIEKLEKLEQHYRNLQDGPKVGLLKRN